MNQIKILIGIREWFKLNDNTMYIKMCGMQLTKWLQGNLYEWGLNSYRTKVESRKLIRQYSSWELKNNTKLNPKDIKNSQKVWEKNQKEISHVKEESTKTKVDSSNRNC
jgi:hypothetical protein